MSEMFKRNMPHSFNILKNITVGIAGCGGIGSNVATILTRTGIGKLIIADMDIVEISNLNRQHYFQDDIGKIKVDALETQLQSINPSIKVTKFFGKLTKKNYLDVFHDINILVEALDLASEKKWFIEEWMKNRPSIPIIACSGLSGIGKTNEIQIHQSAALTLCGDQKTDMSEGVMAPRVILVASMMANEIISQILKDKRL